MNKRAFQKLVLDFYKEHKRTFPWRKEITPYRILVSEFMLQQTQVSRVEPKFDAFINVFPTVDALASTPLSAVLAVWSGLGYNRRAKYLHESSQMIINKFGGNIPQETDTLTLLPGVGENTAGAIRAYAFNRPSYFVETNIRRVILHHFFADKTNVTDREVLTVVKDTLDFQNPREWYWALMDYGSYLPKVIDNPNVRSKHYHKQSKFVGSPRQVRGSVIKVLAQKKRLTRSELAKVIDGDLTHFNAVIDALLAERFISIEGEDIVLS